MLDWYCTIDFETASGVPLDELGSWAYAAHPTTEVLVCNIRFRGKGYRWDVYDQRPELRKLAEDPRVIFDAHHDQFEKAIWRCIMVPDFGFPDIPNERWDDTMAACAARAVPQSLEMAALALRLPQQKAMDGSRLVRGLSMYSTRGKSAGNLLKINQDVLKLVHAYCDQDCITEETLRHRLGLLTPEQRQSWLMCEEMNERGVKIDLEFAQAALAIAEQAKAPLLAEHASLTITDDHPNGLLPTQGVKVRHWLLARGVSINDMQKATIAAVLQVEGAEDDIEITDRIKKAIDVVAADPIARRVLEIRYLLNATSISKYETMTKCLSPDGRAKGLFVWHGTSPGRQTSKLLQVQNFPRGTIKSDNPDGMVETIKSRSIDLIEAEFGPPIETISSALRHAIVAEDGHVLMAGDYAGIQARVVLALAGQHDKTKLMAEGADIYCDMASSIYRRPISKKNDPEQRQVGKNSVLGLGFQMGAKKFADKYGRGQPFEFMERVVQIYRNEWAPRVPALWRALGKASTTAVWERKRTQAILVWNDAGRWKEEPLPVYYAFEDGFLTAELPSGRKISYFDPQPSRDAMPWDENDIRQGWKYRAVKQGHLVEVKAFGGLLTENVVMGIETDIMTAGKLALRQHGFFPIMDVHDEVVVEVEEARFDARLFEECMLEASKLDWVKKLRIPIAVEVWDKPTKRYRK